jgi:hypothetical protein
MKIEDFLSEWREFDVSPYVSTLSIADKVALFQHWVSIRKDVAAQQVRNKYWTALSTAIVTRLKDLVEKAGPALPGGQPDTVKELLEGLEQAMEEHRKNNPDG